MGLAKNMVIKEMMVMMIMIIIITVIVIIIISILVAPLYGDWQKSLSGFEQVPF